MKVKLNKNNQAVVKVGGIEKATYIRKKPGTRSNGEVVLDENGKTKYPAGEEVTYYVVNFLVKGYNQYGQLVTLTKKESIMGEGVFTKDSDYNLKGGMLLAVGLIEPIPEPTDDEFHDDFSDNSDEFDDEFDDEFGESVGVLEDTTLSNSEVLETLVGQMFIATFELQTYEKEGKVRTNQGIVGSSIKLYEKTASKVKVTAKAK